MATVLIWNNNEATTKDHKWPGHASVNITDQWASSYGEDNTANFVSWMPRKDSTSHSGSRQGEAKLNIFDDLAYEGYAPDHIIRLKTNGPQHTLMSNVWTGVRNKEIKYTKFSMMDGSEELIQDADSGPSYRFYVKNCSVVVQRVIKAANLPWHNSELIARKSIIWTPLNVKRLANSIKGSKTMLWSELVDELKTKDCITKEVSDLLKKFQRRRESGGSSEAPPRNLNGGGKSKYANKNNDKKPRNPKNNFTYGGERKTLVEIIKLIGR